MLRIMIILLFLLFLLCFMWTQAIRPGKITEERRKKMKPFEETYIAHRGLFSNKGNNKYRGKEMKKDFLIEKSKEEPPVAPENSLEAFRLAVEHGYGIELDVQMSADGQLVVFHDGDLKRMCGISKKVIECTYDELSRMSLLHSKQRIPLFRDVLELVAGQVPLLVEVKPEGDYIKTCESLRDHMTHYKGIYCMESFHPKAVQWFRKNCPDIARGQLADSFPKKKEIHHNLIQFLLSNLLFNFLGRPDFIAYNHKHKNQFSYRLCRKLYKVYNAAWTIRSRDELERARDVFTIFIFDSFIPGG